MTAAEWKYYAHSVDNRPAKDWQLLKDHLKAVAEMSAKFAGDFGCADWGYLAGLWHDIGKYSEEFQSYLKSRDEATSESLPGRMDHSSAGAQHASQSIPLVGHLIAYAIAAHHSGLLDGRAEDACQEKRLAKTLPAWQHGLLELPRVSAPELPLFVRNALGAKDAFTPAFFVRMLFSCLVDADYLDAEYFANPQKRRQRGGYPALEALIPRFLESLDKLESANVTLPITTLRRGVREDCMGKAEQAPGFFSLTVPTGGGKTLSSLAFALIHARSHQFRRVIYVAPFTTIIEQNAEVFRRHLGGNAVLEHHHNLDPEKESVASRLAAENWDAPLIVTTSAQFYDSLFASKPSKSRKLHRLARSVIILDEAQTLPVEYLHPCLRVLEELVNSYSCTVLLCTATQPEIKRRPDFAIGLSGVREITSNPAELHSKLKRVEIAKIGRQTDAELRERLLAESRVLCIVNTTKHARLLFDALGHAKGHFHLSARMCPAHRRLHLWQIRRALREEQTCRVVSTQVVEAGVDIDFPVVYRALAGLDSIAQAAGRCNRDGRMPERGRTYIFTTEHLAAERYFADTANCAEQVMELYPDPLDLRAIENYFKLYYWDQQARWDYHHVLGNFQLLQDRQFPFNFGFSTTADDFHLIADAATHAVIIPWGRRGRAVCERLRAMPAPDRPLLRQAQLFTVAVRSQTWNEHTPRSIRPIHDHLGILECPEMHYSAETGLNLDARDPEAFFA